MNRPRRRIGFAFAMLALVCAAATSMSAQEQGSPLPAGRLAFGAFEGEFAADGAFSIEGEGWPPLIGTWEATGSLLVLTLLEAPSGCDAPGRYEFHVEDGRLSLAAAGADDCIPRRMILDGSTWRPAGEVEAIPARRITHTVATEPVPLPEPTDAEGSWGSFRGPNAAGIAENQNLPDAWNGETGENILWKTTIPGLAHSSPAVWGDRVFVTSAISSDEGATFRPGGGIGGGADQ